MAERQLAVEAEAVAGIAAPHMGAEGATKPVQVLVDVAEPFVPGERGSKWAGGASGDVARGAPFGQRPTTLAMSFASPPSL